MYTYYPIPLHMHSIWERNASMEGHFYNAQKLGIHHMYITDHDVRMGPRHNHISSFDFTKGKLKIEEPSPDPLRPRWHGFTVKEQDKGTDISFVDNALILQALSDGDTWSTVSITFDSSQKRHEWALVASVYLHLSMQMNQASNDTRIMIDVELSQRPPEFKHGHILYVAGNTDGLATPYSTVVSLDDSQKEFHLDLLKDALPVGGGDNVFRTVTFSVSSRRSAKACLNLKNLSFSWDLAYEDGRRAQQVLANELGKKYDITPFVTSEITAAGPHKICFSTKVPILNYQEKNYKISDEEAMRHVLLHGGIYARNHPFEGVKDAFKACKTTDEQETLLNEVIQKFIMNRAWGAAMIEIGFTEGREGISLSSHLKLWDALSSEGILISGYGDSDNHTNDSDWFDGNNFVAYIAAEIPDEEHFTDSMRKGNLYTGDPVYLQNMKVNFCSDKGQPMGSVSTSPNPGNAVFSLSNLPENCKISWTVNGETVKTETAFGMYEGKTPIPTDHKMNFVRVSVYKDERCILLTNPIYHSTNADMIANIPNERRFNFDF